MKHWDRNHLNKPLVPKYTCLQGRHSSGREVGGDSGSFLFCYKWVQSVIPLPDLFDWWSCILLWCLCLQEFTSCYEVFWSMQIFQLFSVLKWSSSPATGQPFCPLRVRELRWTCRLMNPLWQYGLVPWVQLYSILVQLSQWEFLVAKNSEFIDKGLNAEPAGCLLGAFLGERSFPMKRSKFFLGRGYTIASWWFQTFLSSFASTWGRFPILSHFFQMGWFNHQRGRLLFYRVTCVYVLGSKLPLFS